MDIDVSALKALVRDKELSWDLVVDSIEQALLMAYQRTEGAAADARVELQVGPIDAPLVHTPVCVSMGNPHVVFFTDRQDDAFVRGSGSLVEHHPLFPEGVNVGFAFVKAPDRIRLRVLRLQIQPAGVEDILHARLGPVDAGPVDPALFAGLGGDPPLQRQFEELPPGRDTDLPAVEGLHGRDQSPGAVGVEDVRNMQPPPRREREIDPD